MNDLSSVIDQVVSQPETLPCNWCWELLTNISKPTQWKTISSHSMSKTGYPVFGANGFVGFYPEYNHESETLTITCRGNTCGTINMVPGKTYITGNSMCVDDISTSNVNTRYLYYALSYRSVKDAISGSAQPQITREGLSQIRFPLPPVPEQKKIAAILTSVDTVIEKTQAQIDKLNDLKTGMMQELLTKGIGPDGKPHTEFKDSPVGRIPVGWEVLSFKNIFSFKNGVNKNKEYFGQGVPIISYRNVFNGNGIYDVSIKAKVDMTDAELDRFSVGYGDVFFTRTSETPDEIGFSNVYLGVSKATVFNGFVIRGRQKAKTLLPEFCLYVFRSNSVRKQMLLNCKFTTRAGISTESLERILVAVPPLAEQVCVHSILKAIDSRLAKVIVVLEKNKNLKKALMQDLLTGKVRVTPDPQ